MNKIFKIKDRLNNDQSVDVKLVSLNHNDVDEFIEFQDEILNALDNKELYAPTSKEEYLSYMEKTYYIVGIKTIEDNKLIAVGVYIKNELDSTNYGYDLGYSHSEILKTSQIESTLVLPRFRGNRLQVLICKELINKAVENGDVFVTATVSPINPYSLNSFLDLGFKNEKEKLKYGGLRRYILSKKL